jgi:hypothetical protein
MSVNDEMERMKMETFMAYVKISQELIREMEENKKKSHPQ